MSEIIISFTILSLAVILIENTFPRDVEEYKSPAFILEQGKQGANRIKRVIL